MRRQQTWVDDPASAAYVADAQGDLAASHGCFRMEVTSGDRRPDAHKFYQRCGYADQAGKSSRFLRDLPTSNDNQDQLLPES